MHLAQELLTKAQCSGNSRSFAKERRALKMRSEVGGRWKLATTNWEDRWSWSSYNYPRSCQRTQCWPFYSLLAFEANWKGDKACYMGVSWADCKSKKIVLLKCHLPLLYTTTMNHFLIGLWHATKSGFYTTSGDNQLSGWTKKQLQSTSQSQTCTKKKVIVTVWWSAASLIHYSFLNPGENHDIWEVCSANGWDALKTATPAAGTGQQNGPSSPALHPAARCEPALQKLNKLGYEVLPHPPYSPDLLPSDYCFFKHLNNFLQGTCFCNQQDTENAFQELVESRSTDFYAIRRDKLISHWQKNVLIIMVPTLIIYCMNLPSYSLGFLLLTDTWVVANFGNYESSGHFRANVYGEWTPGTSRVGPWSSTCGTL